MCCSSFEDALAVEAFDCVLIQIMLIMLVISCLCHLFHIICANLFFFFFEQLFHHSLDDIDLFWSYLRFGPLNLLG